MGAKQALNWKATYGKYSVCESKVLLEFRWWNLPYVGERCHVEYNLVMTFGVFWTLLMVFVFEIHFYLFWTFTISFLTRLNQLVNYDRFVLTNARPRAARPVIKTLDALFREVLATPLYSSDFAPSDYHLFRTIHNTFSIHHFHFYAEIKNWFHECIARRKSGILSFRNSHFTGQMNDGCNSFDWIHFE